MWASRLLNGCDNLVHGLSSASDGNMSFKRPSGNPSENRRRFFKSLSLKPSGVSYMKMVHGSRVARVNRGNLFFDKVDALYTFKKGIFLFATYADCVPVFIYEPETSLIGLIHAGWRGTVGEIGKKFMQAVKKEGVRSEKVLVAMGPHIKKCCFEVGEEVLKLFGDKVKDGKLVNLSLALKRQFIGEGVKEENIEISTICTLCGGGYFSHRRPGNNSAMGAIIGLKSV